MYRISAHAAGATPVQVRERDRVTDIDALIAGATPRTRLIFVANPNNPTGTMIGLPELSGWPAPCRRPFWSSTPPCRIASRATMAAPNWRRLPNVVATRTFSKIYGLGGLRIGWGYGPRDIIDVLNRIRGPFNLSHAALEGAEAAMRDRDHIARCQSENARMRNWLAEALAEKGVPSDTSCANFILARFADTAIAEA